MHEYKTPKIVSVAIILWFLDIMTVFNMRKQNMTHVLIIL